MFTTQSFNKRIPIVFSNEQSIARLKWAHFIFRSETSIDWLPEWSIYFLAATLKKVQIVGSSVCRSCIRIRRRPHGKICWKLSKVNTHLPTSVHNLWTMVLIIREISAKNVDFILKKSCEVSRQTPKKHSWVRLLKKYVGYVNYHDRIFIQQYSVCFRFWA